MEENLNCTGKVFHNMLFKLKLEVGHSKTVVSNLAFKPVGYGTKRSSGHPKIVSSALKRRPP